MRTLEIRMRELSGRDAVHDYFEKALELPAWYGRNLDALFDVLTEPFGETAIRVDLGRTPREKLDPYFRQLLRVLADAAKENEDLSLEIVNEAAEEAFETAEAGNTEEPFETAEAGIINNPLDAEPSLQEASEAEALQKAEGEPEK